MRTKLKHWNQTRDALKDLGLGLLLDDSI